MVGSTQDSWGGAVYKIRWEGTIKGAPVVAPANGEGTGPRRQGPGSGSPGDEGKREANSSL